MFELLEEILGKVQLFLIGLCRLVVEASLECLQLVLECAQLHGRGWFQAGRFGSQLLLFERLLRRELFFSFFLLGLVYGVIVVHSVLARKIAN